MFCSVVVFLPYLKWKRDCEQSYHDHDKYDQNDHDDHDDQDKSDHDHSVIMSILTMIYNKLLLIYYL